MEGSQKVSPKPSVLQAEQPQLYQPLLIGEVFHLCDHFCGPLLDPLQQVHVFPVLRTPELDAVLQVGSSSEGTLLLYTLHLGSGIRPGRRVCCIPVGRQPWKHYFCVPESSVFSSLIPLGSISSLISSQSFKTPSSVPIVTLHPSKYHPSAMKVARPTGQMKCLYTNALSMGNKQEKLEAKVLLESYDLIAITETWWDESHDWNVALDGYRLFRRDR